MFKYIKYRIFGLKFNTLNDKDYLFDDDGKFVYLDKLYSGKVIKQNDDGKSIMSYRKGVLHGLYNEVYVSGNQKTFGRFKNGMKDGDWFYNDDYIDSIYVNGRQETRDRKMVTYVNDEIIKVEQYKNDFLVIETHWRNGKLNGKFIEHKDDHYVTGNYIEGMKNGVWLIYNKDNIIKREETYENDDLKKYKIFDRGSVKSFNSDGELHGICTETIGSIRTIDTNEGLKFVPKIEKLTTYQNGLKHGIFKKHELLKPLGRYNFTVEGFYYNDKKHGVWNSSGSNMIGPGAVYYKNGEKVINGTCDVFDTDFNITKNLKIKNGRAIED